MKRSRNTKRVSWTLGVKLCHKPGVLVTEARLLSSSSIPDQQKYSKIFSTLGIVCKCCDGETGECTSTRTECCSKLQCFPWKTKLASRH
ncbi:hypothetical protein I3843_Q009100 [Carya illinoinensis]|nr:hypothetical protein I3843_Q009100 [Carya illinoinensis]